MARLTTLTALIVALHLSGPAASWPEHAEAQQADNGLAISGTVMVRGTREPRSGIRVGLSGPDQTASDAFFAIVSGTARTATTDSNGRFGFSGLAPGRYEVSLASPENGPSSILQSGKTITLTEFSPPPQIELWITPESRISGRVLGPDGEPMSGAIVTPMIRSWFNGAEWLRMVSLPAQQRTDEEGRYSLTVPPGTYYLQVGPLSESPLFLLHPNLQDPIEASEILPFYYPGVPYPEDAIPLSVGEGADLGGVTIQSVGAERLRLRFRLPLPEYVTPIPEPIRSYLDEGTLPVEARLRPLGRGLINVSPYGISLEAEGDEVYLTQEVPAGDYELLISYSRSLMEGVLRDFGQQDLSPIARVRITVSATASDDNVAELGTLSESVKVSIPGRVLLRDIPYGDADFLRLPTMTLADTILGPTRRTGFSRTGTFVFKAVPPGLYQFLGLGQLPDGWYVASVMSGGRDVLKDGLEVDGSEAAPIEIVLADGAGSIRGVARDRNESLVPDVRIVLVPELNRRSALAGTFPTAVGDHSGAYSLENVPPGEYRMLALDVAGRDLIPFWDDPAFLREYERLGERITVDPGARIVINAEAIPLSN